MNSIVLRVRLASGFRHSGEIDKGLGEVWVAWANPIDVQ
jgi:hypothetical protein